MFPVTCFDHMQLTRVLVFFDEHILNGLERTGE